MTAGGERVGPYGQAAERYFELGWTGVLPVVGKWPPPKGFTGHDGAWTSYADVYAWTETRGGDNVCLRLPDGVLGIDVDVYDGKRGALTLTECVERWGALPDTWVSTSRTDGSGIRLYRVPKGKAWPGQLPGGGVELIHAGHRYAMVAPSLHPEGRAYRWTTTHPDHDSPEWPDPAGLPWLPLGWVNGLSKGEQQAIPRASIDSAEDWAIRLPLARMASCARMDAALTAALGELAGPGSRHEAVLDGVMRVARLGEMGHPGAYVALGRIRDDFLSRVTSGSSPRSPGAAQGEWDRALDGAASRIAATPSAFVPDHDPCVAPPPPLGIALAGVHLVEPAPVAGAGTPAPVTAQGPGTDEISAPAEPERERTEWWGHPAILGALEVEAPTGLARNDGACVWYPGRVNALIGASESGKTWVALEGVRQYLTAGHYVAYFDFEDSMAGIVGRLRALGVSDGEMANGLRYLSPGGALDSVGAADLADMLTTYRPALIVLDGVNAAMTTQGLELNSNRDATAFFQQVIRPLADTGSTVVTIDHVKKGRDMDGSGPGGAIGAQAKRAMTTGSSMLIENVKPFGRGQTGLLKMSVDKDRPGGVRENCGSGSRVFSMITVIGSPDGSVSLTIAADEDSTDPDTGEFRPTFLMGRVTDYLSRVTDGVSQRTVETAIGGRREYVARALQALVTDGTVITEPGPRRAILHKLSPDWTPEDSVRPVRPSASGTHTGLSASRPPFSGGGGLTRATSGVGEGEGRTEQPELSAFPDALPARPDDL